MKLALTLLKQKMGIVEERSSWCQLNYDHKFLLPPKIVTSLSSASLSPKVNW